MSKRKAAKLRVCTSCEWIYQGYTDCPQCGWGSYGARFVYGNLAYKYAKTQKPWLDKKVARYTSMLQSIINFKSGQSIPVQKGIKWNTY